MNTKNVKGAGILIYFDNTNNFDKKLKKEILYLCLIDKRKGQYDFPKGCIDFNEEILRCAIRETAEETGLMINKNYVLDSNNFNVFADGLAMFSAKYIDLMSSFEDFSLNKSKKIKIEKNPETLLKEHDGFVWLSYDQVCQNLIPYLQTTLDFYNTRIKSKISDESQ